MVRFVAVCRRSTQTCTFTFIFFFRIIVVVLLAKSSSFLISWIGRRGESRKGAAEVGPTASEDVESAVEERGRGSEETCGGGGDVEGATG